MAHCAAQETGLRGHAGASDEKTCNLPGACQAMRGPTGADLMLEAVESIFNQ